MAKELNKIWAEGQPLDEYFSRILDEVRDSESDAGESVDLSDELQSSRSNSHLLRALEHYSSQDDYREKASAVLKKQLVSGAIRIVGRTQRSDGSYAFELIGSDFWIGADVSPTNNSARLGETSYDELVVAKSMPAVPLAASITEEQFEARAQKVPAPKQLRLLAIEACYEAHLIDFDAHDSNRKNRTEIYREWIAENYQACDTAQPGFSEPSFEADETKFKKSKGLAQPKK